MKKIKVLVVDDSLLFRELLAKSLSKDPSLEVVGTASNPYEARDKILELEPDVMTLDVEMPRMDGIEFLKRLMPQYPIPVVVVSGVDGIVFDALDAGAVDFVAKLDYRAKGKSETLIDELVSKIKIASTAKLEHFGNKIGRRKVISSNRHNKTDIVIAIGASTGGTEAIEQILRVLPRATPGLVIVQHMPPVFTKLYADRLNASCAIEVREAQNGDKVEIGVALIAPGDYHMRLKKVSNQYIVECFKGEKVNGHCPSVDVLFESVALHGGKNAIGIILTGMGSDGAKGLLAMRQKGARTLGQDERTSVVYGMPKAAYALGAIEKQSPLERIPNLICSYVRG